LAVALAGQGVAVRVVAPASQDVPDHEILEGIRVDRFRYAPRRYENLAYTGNMAGEVERSWSAKIALVGFLGAQFAAATRVRREWEPDIVHAHWWFPGGLVGTWVAGLADLPLVTTMHGSDVRLARASAYAKPLFRSVMRRSRAVTTVSHWLAQAVRDMAPDAQPRVAPMPVATSLFAPATNAQRSGDRLLFVGRLNAQKGLAGLLSALAGMRVAAALDVVGDGVDAESLKAMSVTLGLSERVTWHGAQPQNALPRFYQRAAAVVVPSVDEGLGLVAAEAQLCEAPVVAYNSGGMIDTIRDNETGILVPPHDTAALGRALDELLADASRRDALGQSGRASALAVFAPESAARRYVELYRGVTAL
jgi:glycosyltransferase involved in cell wall biosynthesis